MDLHAKNGNESEFPSSQDRSLLSAVYHYFFEPYAIDKKYVNSTAQSASNVTQRVASMLNNSHTLRAGLQQINLPQFEEQVLDWPVS